jgi:hypothetical protein
MGLHKNTIAQKISPFESELRLRLWWQIILLDCKAAKLSGFAWDIKNDNHFNSQPPLNINDANLYPEMTELPTEITTHSTEMLLCLVIYECASVITNFPNLVGMASCEEEEFHTRSNHSSKSLSNVCELSSCASVMKPTRFIFLQAHLLESSYLKSGLEHCSFYKDNKKTQQTPVAVLIGCRHKMGRGCSPGIPRLWKT